MIKPKSSWIYFKIIKVVSVGSIVLSESAVKEKEEVKVVAVGPDVKDVKVGDLLILRPMNVIQHSDPEDKEASMYGFVQEENIIAQVTNDKK